MEHQQALWQWSRGGNEDRSHPLTVGEWQLFLWLARTGVTTDSGQRSTVHGSSLSGRSARSEEGGEGGWPPLVEEAGEASPSSGSGSRGMWSKQWGL